MATETSHGAPSHDAKRGVAGLIDSASQRRLLLLLPIVAILALALWAMFTYWPAFNALQSATVTAIFAIALSALLALLPAVLCFVQNVSRRRQMNRLHGLRHLPLADTVSYQTALTAVDASRLVVDGDYLLPIFTYFLFSFVGFVTIFVGFGRIDFFKQPTVLLGGLLPTTDAGYPVYQMQTFTVVAMAFVGSYVYALGRILDRINNNDLYPISLYYYTARIVIACAAAAVLRHALVLFSESGALFPTDFGTDAGRAILVLMGFVVGFTPDLFLIALSRKGFQLLKIWGSRDDPAKETLPTTLPLLMIDDLTREKIDRLNELGIDSAQVLARQNPLLLLPRLPYDLGLIVDWVAQAQLYALVRGPALAKLRPLAVRDILDFAIRLADEESGADVAAALGLGQAAVPALAAQLERDVSFARLRELASAMRPGPTAPAVAAVPPTPLPVRSKPVS